MICHDKILPQRLQPGDTIGIAAPAGAFDLDSFELGIKIIQAHGFQCKIPEGLFEKKGYFAGDDCHRATIFQSLFTDPTIHAILCARGGFGSMKILPLLNFDVIASHPKRLIGFSDVSALLCTLTQKSRIITFHGPMVTKLKALDDVSLQSLFSCLLLDTFVIHQPKDAIIIREGQATGPLIGGNLTTLCHLIGTPFEPDFSNHIVFLEDIGEAIYRIDRMISHMVLAGCFNSIHGILLGSFNHCGDYQTICHLFESMIDMDIPIIAGFDCGHGIPNMCLPIGLNLSMNTFESIMIQQIDETFA